MVVQYNNQGTKFPMTKHFTPNDSKADYITETEFKLLWLHETVAKSPPMTHEDLQHCSLQGSTCLSYSKDLLLTPL
jgi:hypothetical protein